MSDVADYNADPLYHLWDRWAELGTIHDTMLKFFEKRPLLRPSQHPYGRYLLLRAIELCEEAIEIGDKPEEAAELKETLEKLLDEKPPPVPPTPSALQTSGAFFL
jgi:hypothetical protein